MNFFPEVGPPTWMSPGAVHHWTYGWGDTHGFGMCLAGANLNTNGSAGSVLWSIKQGKAFRIDNGPFRTEYHVIIENEGPETVLYNLQVVSWP